MPSEEENEVCYYTPIYSRRPLFGKWQWGVPVFRTSIWRELLVFPLKMTGVCNIIVFSIPGLALFTFIAKFARIHLVYE